MQLCNHVYVVFIKLWTHDIKYTKLRKSYAVTICYVKLQIKQNDDSGDVYFSLYKMH